MTITDETRPEWLPDEYEHVVVTHEDPQAEVAREARRHFRLTAGEFLRIYQASPERHRGASVCNSLCCLPDFIAQSIEA